jgi:hypothetical protein
MFFFQKKNINLSFEVFETYRNKVQKLKPIPKEKKILNFKIKIFFKKNH